MGPAPVNGEGMLTGGNGKGDQPFGVAGGDGDRLAVNLGVPAREGEGEVAGGEGGRGGELDAAAIVAIFHLIYHHIRGEIQCT